MHGSTIKIQSNAGDAFDCYLSLPRLAIHYCVPRISRVRRTSGSGVR